MASGGIPHDLDFLVAQGGGDVGEEAFRHIAVHEQRLGGVAHAHPLTLRVDGDGLCHRQIGRPIHVHVAVACEVLEHRHPRLGTDPPDERFATPGDHDVDEVVHLQKRAHRLPVGGIDQLHAVGRQAGGHDCPPHALHDPRAGMGRLLAAAEDDGVAGREGHRRGVSRDVGPRLVDEEDHAERHPNLADDQAAGLRGLLDHLPHGIRQ